VTFNVPVNPTSTTTYTLISITNGNGCKRTSGFGKTTAVITVNNCNHYRTVGSDDWSTVANWETSTDLSTWVAATVAPDEDDYTITIQDGHTVNVDAGVTADQVTIKPQGEVIVDAGVTLTLNDGQGDDLTIESDASNTGRLEVLGDMAYTGSAQAAVQRYVPDGNWHIVSPPVSGHAFTDFGTSTVLISTGGYYYILPYNEGADKWDPWIEDDNGSPMEVGKGYMLKTNGAQTITFLGQVNYGDQPAVPIPDTKFGWNAVGNTFTTPISGTAFINTNKDDLDPKYAAIYVWNQDDYEVISTNDFALPPLVPGGESGLGQTDLAVGQGFVVKARDNSSREVLFTTGMQIGGTGTSFKSGSLSWPAVRLKASFNSDIDGTVAAFNEDMTTGLDPTYDIGKLKGDPDFSIYTKMLEDNGTDYAIQALPDRDFDTYRIPVGFDFTNGGQVTFSADYVNLPPEMQVILEDTETKTFTRLDLAGATHVTEVSANNKGYGRFYLLTGEALATDASLLNQEIEYKLFTREKLIFVNGPATKDTRFALYSIDGKLLYNERAENTNQHVIDGNAFPTGVYLLKIIDKGQVHPVKFVLK